jgi:O-antigen/teichoic acid export membrane protein
VPLNISKNIISFGKHGIIYAVGSTLHSLLAVFLIPLYTRYLDPSDYGVLGLLMVVSSISGLLALSGGSGAMIRSFYDYDTDEGKKVVFSTTFYWVLFNGILITLFCSIIYNKISNLIFSNEDTGILILLMTITGAVGALKMIPQNIFKLYKKSLLYITLETSTFIVGVLFILYFVIIKQLGLFGVVAGLLLSSILSFLILFVFILNKIVLKVDFKELKKQFIFGVPLIFAGFSSILFSFSSRFFIKHYHSLEIVGIFTLSQQITGVMITLFNVPLKMIWGPVFLENYKKTGHERFFKYATDYVFFIALSLSLGIAIFSKDLLFFIAPIQYQNASSIIPILLLGILFWSTNPMFNGGIIAERKTKFIAVNFFFGAIVNIILNILLIPKWGMYGAAWASTVSYLLMFINIILYNNKLGFIFIHLKRNIKLLGVALIIYYCSTFISSGVLILSILYKILLLLVGSIVIMFIGYLTTDEINFIKTKLRKIL